MADPIGSFSGLASGIQWREMVDQIMSLEEARKLSPVQAQLANRENTRSAWSSYGSLVSRLKDSAAKLLDGSAFRKFSTTAGKTPAGASPFTATASDSAQAGSYAVEVIRLARAEKLNGSQQSSVSDALGVSGDFIVNGRRVDLAATDSLASVRDKINALNSGSSASGVTATILTTSATSHRLILTADNTGSRGIELVDGANHTLQSLGIVSGSQTRNASPLDSSATDTQRFRGKSQALATMLGVSAPPAVTTIKIAGQKIRVDLSSDTLISVMNRVKDAGGSAEIVEENVGGTTQFRLSVAGTVTADLDPDADAAASQRIVELMGFVQNDKSAQITTGQDAKARVDGFTLTRRTNTISDAIAGVTVDLVAADTSAKVVTPTGADLSVKSSGYLPNGSYAVALSSSTNRTTGVSGADLALGTVPPAVAAGSYAVNVTALAQTASVTGSGFDGTYNPPFLGTDWIRITDGNGSSSQVNLSDGTSLNTIVSDLNTAFAADGVAVQAVNEGGQLKLVSTTDAGSASTFTIASSGATVASNLGIANGTYGGSDIQGTIGGQAATGSGNVLTGAGGTAAAGLQATYTGAVTGAVGTVTVTDSTATTATIGGVAAQWDSATKTITGAAGSDFEGLVLSYAGAVTNGSIGSISAAGDIAAPLTIARDLDAAVTAIQSFASAYNALDAFADTQRGATAGLRANGTLRAMLGSIKGVLLTDVPGLTAGTSTPYVRGGNVGVALTKTGTLEVDAGKLKAALATNLTDVMTLFGTGATATDGEVSYKASTANTKPGTYAVSITAAATRGSHTGSDLGGAFTYSASNGVSDTLTVTDSYSGVTTSYVVRQGESLDTIVSELNSAFGNSLMSLTAERSGNSLRIRGSEYGSTRSLTLAGTATTRLGMTAGTYAGSDVQGTIGGNAATGSGQVLTASLGFPTEGLAITYLGSAAKLSAGTLRFARGIAGEMSAITDRQSRSGDGAVTVQTEVLDRSMELLNDRIDNIQSRLDLRRQALIKQFTRMEEALSRFQSQSSSLISQLGSLSANSVQ